MIVVRILPLILLFLWIVLQRIDVRIIRQNAVTVQISFPIFRITFKDLTAPKRKTRKIVRLIKNLPFTLKTVAYLTRKSRAIIHDTTWLLAPSTPTEILKKIPHFISTRSIYAYLDSNAKSTAYIKYNSNPIFVGDIDIVLQTKLIHLIISPLLFLYYKISNKARRMIKSV